MRNKDIYIKREKKVEILNFLSNIGTESTKKEIIKGLKAKQKFLSPKFFYDKKGSELFEEITKLEEYYPTRTEIQILSNLFKKIDINFNNLNIIELGSGDSSKIKILLKQIHPETLSTINYFPVDISKSAIEKSVKDLSSIINLNSIIGIVSDFHLQLNKIPSKNHRLFCFLGSTIGNFSTEEMHNFMQHLGNQMQTDDSLILGMDMIKDINILELAYNDKKGNTARFNLNILTVVNKIIGSNFNQKDFEHLAFFNKEKSRIEMHLKAINDVEISSLFFINTLKIKQGETIHTENSYKFDDKKIKQLAKWANLKVKSIYSDKKSWFNIVHFEK